jgi:lysophospholipase L1-like esterase
MTVDAQKFNDLINLNRYAKENLTLSRPTKKENRIIFLGNSITEGWVRIRPQFFEDNNFVGRGISGQTSSQLLSRFRNDVINLKPTAVVINIGTNDIAGNTGEYNAEFTLGNIKSMVDLSKANNIKVVLTSVLPAKRFAWNKDIEDATTTITDLNKEIRNYAKNNKILYIDYHSQLRDENNALKSNFGNDGVHPNEECYRLMEEILINSLTKAKIIK